MVRKSTRALGLILLVGCGPPRIPTADEGAHVPAETESSSGSIEETSTSDTSTSDTSTSDEGTGDGDPDAGTTMGFVPMGDIIEGLPPCDPFQQTTCPEGEKCVAVASWGNWDGNFCVPVTGTGEVGDPCVYDGPLLATDDCDADSACWSAIEIDGVFTGTCTGFCLGSVDDSSCADPNASCRINNDDAIAMCLPECDPLLPDCEPGLGCYWSETSDAFHCVAGSIEYHSATDEPCGFNNDCDPGNACVDADAFDSCNAFHCCAMVCELGLDPSPCAPNYACLPFFPDGTAPEGHEDLGVCVGMVTAPLIFPDAW
jgi:hypothetical protein